MDDAADRFLTRGPNERAPAPVAPLRLLVVCAAVLVVALVVRWRTPDGGAGAAFLPRPDALEYVASAQSIAQSGDYFLQVGALRARPRYPPGLPLLQALALRTGLDPQRLVAVHEAVGALTAALVALLAGLWAAAIAPGAARQRAATGAAALAGLVWAVAPIALRSSQLTLSDEPAAFVSLLALGATAAAARTRRHRVARGAAVAAGALAVLATGLRLVAGPLLAAPMLLLALDGTWSREAARRALRLGAWALLGGLVPLAAISGWLHAAGWSAWPWSGYAWWAPDAYGPGGSAFSIGQLVEWRARFAEGDPEGLSNGALLLSALLGLPGGPPRGALGLLWPAAAWIAILPVGRAVRGGRASAGRAWSAGLLALGAWTLTHALLYGAYTFASPRFFVAPLAALTVLAGAQLGAALSVAVEAPSRLALAAGATLVVLLSLVPNLRLWPALRRPAPDPRPAVAAAVDAWLALAPEDRARSRVPFDPLEAQALGLLAPERIGGIEAWGELPPTVQVRALRERGRL